MRARHGLLLAALLCAACHRPDPAARLSEAQAAYAAEDYVKARDAVLAGLESRPDDPTLLQMLVRADLALGDGEGAGRAVDRLTALGQHGRAITELAAEAALKRGQMRTMARLLTGDTSAVAWRLRGEAALAAGDPVAALGHFEQGAAIGGDYRLAFDFARMMIDAEDWTDAETALAAMREAAPGKLDTLMTAGTIATARGRYDAADAAYAEAARRYPARIEPIAAAAELAGMRGQLDRMQRLLASADALNPGDDTLATLHLHLLAARGDWTGLRRRLAPQEARLDPHGYPARVYGEALFRLGQIEAARAILAPVVVVAPRDPDARLLLAQCGLALGDARAALDAIKPLAQSALAGRAELAIAVHAAEALSDPIAAQWRARLSSSQLPAIEAHAAAAAAAFAREDWAAALDHWSAIPGHDTDTQVLARMALAQSGLGHADAAIALADAALARDPHDPVLMHTAGRVRLDAERDITDAQVLLRQAWEHEPGNALFRADYARSRN